MIAMRALIDDRGSFDRIEQCYRMFSHDRAYHGDDILIEPAKIHRVSTRSIAPLLQALVLYARRGDKSFLIATHGNPDGLPIRIRANNAATMNSDIVDDLVHALGPAGAQRTTARENAMLYEAGGQRVFANEGQLDELLGLLREVRQQRLEHIEFRGCNIGAGPALRSLHRLIGAQITAAPTVQFIWSRLATANQQTISAEAFAEQVANLPPQRRTFTRVDCYGGDRPDNDEVVAIGIDGDMMRIVARDRASIKGWTQAYLQQSTLFALGREPPGGGYHPGGPLPIVGLLTPNGRLPFVVPGDAFEYTAWLAHEMQPPTGLP